MFYFLLRHFEIANDPGDHLFRLHILILIKLCSFVISFPMQYSSIYSRDSVLSELISFRSDLFEIQRPVIIHNSNVTGTVSIRPRTFAELKRGTNCKHEANNNTCAHRDRFHMAKIILAFYKIPKRLYSLFNNLFLFYFH